VTIVTDLTLQGAVAQYGRGVVADVSNQLVKQFAQCIAQQLQRASAAPEPEALTDEERAAQPRFEREPAEVQAAAQP
jgi:hypothetical protein